jgi:hypothetical protein
MQAQPPLFYKYIYIDRYAAEAVNQMLEFRIPASVTLAQAILESGRGTSRLARLSNNHFGIKCHREWGGEFTRQDDDSLNECFRVYQNIRDSYTDHSMFLFSRARYAPLFDLSITDYKGWCYGLKACGYATAPGYAEELIRIIEEFELYELDGPVSLLSRIETPPAAPEVRTSPFDASRGQLRYFAACELLFSDGELPKPAPPHVARLLSEPEQMYGEINYKY